MPLLSFTLAGADPMTVLSLINTAHGTPQPRPAYLADVALHRTRPQAIGTAWHVDTLSNRAPDDPAWRAWRSGRRHRALSLLDAERSTIQAQQQASASHGLTLRQLILAPFAISGYAAFALEATRIAVEAGTQVRVLTDSCHVIPEMTVYGDVVYRLRATKNQVADGAVRLDRPDLAAALHPHLSTLWHQATKFLTYYYTAQQETA